jgi:hypothetical protein
MEGSGQLHIPAALSPEEKQPVPIGIGCWLGTTFGLEAVAKRKDSLSLPKNLIPFV